MINFNPNIYPPNKTFTTESAHEDRPVRFQSKIADPNTVLRRFIDLPKLLDLLTTSSLTMTRLSRLLSGDPFECSSQKTYSNYTEDELKPIVEKHARLISEIDSKARNSVTDLTGRIELIKNLPLPELRKAVWCLEQEHLKRFMTCSCWHIDSTESDAMWQLYSKFGVCIKTTIERLGRSFRSTTTYGPKRWDPTIYLDQIDYVDSPTCAPHEPWLVKRRAFKWEQEARLYCEVPDAFHPVGWQFHVDLPTLIEEITVTPYAEKWQYNALEKTIVAVFPGSKSPLLPNRFEDIQISHSTNRRPPELDWPVKDGLSSLAKLFL